MREYLSQKFDRSFNVSLVPIRYMSRVNIELAIAYAIISSTEGPEFFPRETLNSSFRLLVLCVTEENTGNDLRLDVRWKERDSRVHDSGSLAILMSVSTSFENEV